MQTQFFERPGGRLAYDDTGGSGELVLMLPGIGALRSEYRFLAPPLAQAGYRAVSVDLRGQGESSVPWQVYDVPSVGEDIITLIEHLGCSHAHLIGTSFAAAPVIWAAAEQPERVRSMVLINGFVRVQKINPIMQALFWLMTHNPWRLQAWVMYYKTLYPTTKPADFKEYLNALASNLAEPGRQDATNSLASSSRSPSHERMVQVKAPALVIMGGKDPDFPDPAEEGRLIAAGTRGTLEIIPGAGHYPQTEMPERTTPVILDFLKRASARTA